MIEFINIADLKDPHDPLGRTYRQVNADKKHAIPIGTLVELVNDNTDFDEDYKGVRLYVVHHSRDCDQTPLYCLSANRRDTAQDRTGFANAAWLNGWCEENLRVVDLDNDK
jgi:hypothetical protein